MRSSVGWATLALGGWLALGAGRWACGSLLPLEAERLRASVGGYAVMNCHLDFPFGNEIPYHLHWDKDARWSPRRLGESIYSWYSGSGEEQAQVGDRWGGRVRRLREPRAPLGRGSINVSAVRETDAGLYRCRVSFPNRTPPARNNGTFYYLDVDGGNLIATPPMNVTVLEGARAELECRPKSPESVVEWMRDGAPLAATPELAQRSERPHNGSLVIRSAASADPGEYECRVQDPTGLTQSASAFLDVQYAAKVVYAPPERHLPLGKPASLDCHFSANPPLTNLRWEKDGFLFDPYNVPGVFYSRNGSLLFNQVDESHEGQYSCTAYNALGTAGASPRVRVRVMRPPALAARPQPLYVARLGATLTLPCALGGVDADATAPLLWTRKDGTPLPEGRHSMDSGSLTIVDVAVEDRGVYSCSASNEAATVAADTELLVENVPPLAPRALSAAARTAGAVHVSWLPGASGLQMEYIVWYRERAASEWRTMKILSRGVTEATVAGLRPATEYEVRVLAQDAIGDGLFSKPIFVRTQDPAGPEAPPSETAAPPVDDSTDAADEEEESTAGAGAGALAASYPPAPPPQDELAVTVRLLEEGALVRWTRALSDDERCSVHWYEGDRLRDVLTTYQDYILVDGASVEEGAAYRVRVQCAGGAGAATLQVPAYGRLRAVAAGCAGAALLLAALAGTLFAARRRLLPASASRHRNDKRAR